VLTPPSALHPELPPELLPEPLPELLPDPPLEPPGQLATTVPPPKSATTAEQSLDVPQLRKAALKQTQSVVAPPGETLGGVN
jgi:hypothetical protein